MIFSVILTCSLVIFSVMLTSVHIFCYVDKCFVIFSVILTSVPS